VDPKQQPTDVGYQREAVICAEAAHRQLLLPSTCRVPFILGNECATVGAEAAEHTPAANTAITRPGGASTEGLYGTIANTLPVSASTVGTPR